MAVAPRRTEAKVGLRRGSFDGVKVFSATMLADRACLGEKVSAWLAANPRLQVVDMIVTQSSDASFHCIAITIFWKEL